MLLGAFLQSKPKVGSLTPDQGDSTAVLIIAINLASRRRHHRGRPLVQAIMHPDTWKEQNTTRN